MIRSVGPCRSRGFLWLVLAVLVGFSPRVSAIEPDDEIVNRRELEAAFVLHRPAQFEIDAAGSPSGFVRDMTDRIAALAGFRVQYRVFSSVDRAVAELQAGHVDFITNLDISPENARFGTFTAPVETFAISVFVRHTATQFEQLEDFVGRRVGMVRSSGDFGTVALFDVIDVVWYDGPRAALFDLVSGQLDAVVFSRVAFAGLARKLDLDDKIKTVGPPLRVIERGILIRRNDTALSGTINEAVRRLTGTAAHSRIHARWYGETPPFWTISRVAWLMGGLAAIGLIASFGWRYHSVARLNRKLSRQAAILRAVLGNADQGVSLFDTDLKSVAFNDRYFELLDLPSEYRRPGVQLEKIIRFLAERGDYGPGDVVELVRERVENAKRFEVRNVVRTGTNGLTIDIRSNPIPGGGFVATYTDITDRVRVEDRLRRSEEQLSEAQRIGQIGHWRYYPKLHRFECSEAFYQIYGWDRGQQPATYAAITAAVHPDDRAGISELRKNAGKTMTGYTCEFRIVRPSGEIRHVRGEACPEFDESGQLISFFGVNQDITEQKRTEKELLRERTRAELANRAKSEFLANMSHEIRTPLNAIIGFADIMENQVFGDIGNARYVDYISDIHTSARHLLELVNDILDISAIEAGEVALSPIELEISEIFDECMRFVREQAHKAEVEVVPEARQAPMTVYADRRALRQILLNLLSNAIKFTPPGGRVSMHVETTADTVAIVVTDTGVGIPAEELPKITQPFETGSNNPHTLRKGNPNIRPEGTGLGLAIVRSLVKLHGGDLQIASGDGEGTTVRVRFPRTQRVAA